MLSRCVILTSKAGHRGLPLAVAEGCRGPGALLTHGLNHCPGIRSALSLHFHFTPDTGRGTKASTSAEKSPEQGAAGRGSAQHTGCAAPGPSWPEQPLCVVLVEVKSTEPGVRDPQWTVSCAVTSSVLFPGILPLFPHPSAPLATTGPLPVWVNLFWTTHKSGIHLWPRVSLVRLSPLGWVGRGRALPGLLREHGVLVCASPRTYA